MPARNASRRRNSRFCPLAYLALIGFGSTSPAQVTTNDWISGGTGVWTNDANWSLSPEVPDSNIEVAQFTNNFAGNFTVTQDVNLTINGIIFEDSGGDPDAVLSLNRTGSQVLTFDGANPFIESRSSSGGGAGINFNQPIDVGAAGVTKTGFGVANLAQGIFGNGTITISSGPLEVRANNTNFTGQFVINGGILDIRGANANALGSTNVGTVVNGTGQLRFRDQYSVTMASEPVTINGFYNQGSIKCYASSNVTFNGPITLNTNGVIALDHWFSTALIEPGGKRDWFLNSDISDDGNARGVHFFHHLAQNSATGTASRTSEFVVGGASTYGGFTHITAGRAPDSAGPFSGVVRLTNGNDRLPIGTTVILGGLTNGVGIASGNGRLVLNGYNQELAGLVTMGTGISNRVVGGQAALSMLTLNIGAGITNRFSGTLGGPDTFDDYLVLISKGPGILDLSGNNTYIGYTAVTNGTLRVNGTHIGGGDYAILAGGTLGGTGTIDAAVASLPNSFIAPGNDGPGGSLTLGNLDLDGTLQIRLDNGVNDLLDVNGIFDITNGVLQLVYSDSLTNSTYVFAEYDTLAGDAFFNVLNMPNGYTIDYSYNGNQIALLIPEPSTLALLALGLILIGRLAVRRQRRN